MAIHGGYLQPTAEHKLRPQCQCLFVKMSRADDVAGFSGASKMDLLGLLGERICSVEHGGVG